MLVFLCFSRKQCLLDDPRGAIRLQRRTSDPEYYNSWNEFADERHSACSDSFECCLNEWRVYSLHNPQDHYDKDHSVYT